MDALAILAIVLASALPPIFYLIWVRNTELCEREPFRTVVATFLFGASFAILGSFLLESLIMGVILGSDSVFWQFLRERPEAGYIVLVVVVAPVVEESLKAASVLVSIRWISELEDGLVYGAAVGLGFAAVENMLYLNDALSAGIAVFITTAVARAVTSTILHASATAVSGLGISRWKMLRMTGRRSSPLPFLLTAILLHGVFNFLAILGIIYGGGQGDVYFVGLALGASLAVAVFIFVRRSLRDLDRATCPK